MRPYLLLAAALCFSTSLVAQEPPAASGQTVCEKFTVQLHRLDREYRAARKSDPKTAPPDFAGLARRALSEAESLTGDDRVKVSCWAAVNGRDPEIVRQVVEQITKQSLKSAAIEELMENAMSLSRALGEEESAHFLRLVVTTSPHAVVRAWAMYWQAIMMQRNREATDAQKAQAAELLLDAEKLAKGTLLGDRLAGPKFIEERLQIGMTAPDIVGEDVDGVAFQLTDYRGKVVVLDFWGFW